MAFRELAEGLAKTLPSGASSRYALLTTLEKMLTGELYEHLPYKFEDENLRNRTEHVPIRERRPSTDFNLAYEITQDTLAELFGDEQFPIVQVTQKHEPLDAATKNLADLIEVLRLEDVVVGVYEEGVVGSVAIVVHVADNGYPFFDVIPGKWCEPVYRSAVSDELIALPVTYPIDEQTAEEKCPGITKREENSGVEVYWYRYVVGPQAVVEYEPLSDDKFAKLGEVDKDGKKVEFVEYKTHEHAFRGRVPAVFIKNLGGNRRIIDGPCLWWPIRNICVEIDYTLSQAGRGLRYGADPMLFVRLSEIDYVASKTKIGPGGNAAAEGATQTAARRSRGGAMVKGSTQTLVGGPESDAKLLEISAKGIQEEREFVRDLREYALEILGGMKARAEHLKGAASGVAIDKGLKPLRRLVRRQRRPYGRALRELIDLVLYGYDTGAFTKEHGEITDVDVDAIPLKAKKVLEWPSDETMGGQELYYHVLGRQLEAGGNLQHPVQFIKPEVAGAKLAADLGYHEPFQTIKGSCAASTPASDDPNKPNPDDPSPPDGGTSS